MPTLMLPSAEFMLLRPGWSSPKRNTALPSHSILRHTDFRLNLGTTLQKEDKLPPAEAEFLTAIGLEPKNAHAHLALADLLNVEPNRHSEAETEYAEVRALDPSRSRTPQVARRHPPANLLRLRLPYPRRQHP